MHNCEKKVLFLGSMFHKKIYELRNLGIQGLRDSGI
jgi:hypothetical protein